MLLGDGSESILPAVLEEEASALIDVVEIIAVYDSRVAASARASVDVIALAALIVAIAHLLNGSSAKIHKVRVAEYLAKRSFIKIREVCRIAAIAHSHTGSDHSVGADVKGVLDRGTGEHLALPLCGTRTVAVKGPALLEFVIRECARKHNRERCAVLKELGNVFLEGFELLGRSERDLAELIACPFA